MRPVRLELEGFSTFRERVVLDFGGLDLVAFTGPTGAGKSSLIDAITFALYGSVARYDDARRVGPVIHQLANEARVRLDFESGGALYLATRVVRRRPSKGRDGGDLASTREARLERVEPDGATTVLAGDVKELNAAVEELLGLDFAQFTRTIVLPQGEFAAFLRDDPANRDKLLQRLLDLGVYERMGQLARARAKKAGHQIEVHEEQRRRLRPPSNEELAALVDRRDALQRFRAVAADGVVALAELDAGLDPLRERVTAIDRARARLASIEVPEAVDGLDRRLRAAAEERHRREGELAEARQARDRAQAELDELPDKAELARVQSMLESLAEARTAVEALTDEAARLRAEVARLAAESEEFEERVERADAALRSARLAADAAGWTAALRVGEPCPVCHREVETIPDHDATGELEEVEAQHRRITTEARQVAGDLTKAGERERVVTAEIERQRERIGSLERQRSELPGPESVEDVRRGLEAVDQVQGRHRAAVERSSGLEAELAEAARGEDELRRAESELRADLGALRDSVADLAPPPLGPGSLRAGYRSLETWSRERAAELAAERVELAEEGKRVAARRAALVEELTTAAAALDLDPDPAGLVAAVAEASTAAGARVDDAERRRTEDRQTGERIDELAADKVLDEAMGRHLRAGGFGSWLLAEALDAIVVKATVWLLELSNQQYSLVVGDKTFAIVDHNNANETRDVRTLSGGETFLASLALALALADSIAELAPVDAPRLDSMFLDEGFGTLDPGTLDVVAGAIEELASGGRMIGIVTHVADLAERMPVRFRVTKGPSTSTVELVEV